jgi:hypothetical protein
VAIGNEHDALGLSHANFVDLNRTRESGFCNLYDVDRCLLARAPRAKNRLYLLKMQLATPVCLVAMKEDKAWLWHGRYGHLNCCRPAAGDAAQWRLATNTTRSVSHARTLWISTEHERVALPNVAAFSVMIFAIYSRCLHGLRPTITPPLTLALRLGRLMHDVAVTTLAAP